MSKSIEGPWVIGCLGLFFVGVVTVATLVAIDAPRDIPSRGFVYIGSEPKYEKGFERRPKRYPRSDVFHGVRIPPGTTLEVVAYKEGVPPRCPIGARAFYDCVSPSFTVTSFDGQPLTFDTQFWKPGWGGAFNTVDYQYMRVPWDTHADRPLCVSDPRNTLHRYYLWLPHHLVPFSVLFLVVALLAAAHRRSTLWTIPVFMILVLVAWTGNLTSDDQCVGRTALAASFRTGDGRILPVPDYRIVAPYGGVRGYQQAVTGRIFPFMLSLFAANLIFAFLLAPALKGAHYLLVPHPAERAVKRGPAKRLEIDVPALADELGRENVANPPPEFVLQNKTRRIRGLTDLIRAETEAADAVEKHERAKQGRKPPR